MSSIAHKTSTKPLSSNLLLLDTRLASIQEKIGNIRIADLVQGGVVRPLADAVIEIEKLRKELPTIVA